MYSGTDVSDKTITRIIDERAMIHPSAVLGPQVTIGPWVVIGPDVKIGARTKIGAHVVIDRSTTIGEDCAIYSFASIGCDPQDKKYQGEPTRLEIGDRNIFRECVTISRGTGLGGEVTRIGHDNLFMAYVHVAHDCQIGSHTIFSNSVTLAGHVVVEDYAILSGSSGAHQFCRIGAHSFLGMRCAASQDILPFMLVAGAEPRIRGVNVEGLKRRGFSEGALKALKEAYRIVFRKGLLIQEASEALAPLAAEYEEIRYLLDFIMSSERGILR